MNVKCSVCENENPKRKLIKRMPLEENELPEKYGAYREYMCVNIIQILGKDKKWHENICKNRMIVSGKTLTSN